MASVGVPRNQLTVRLVARILIVAGVVTENEPAKTCEEETEERRPRAAEMKRAGWAGREARPDRHRAEQIGRSGASQRRRFETQRRRLHSGGRGEVGS